MVAAQFGQLAVCPTQGATIGRIAYPPQCSVSILSKTELPILCFLCHVANIFIINLRYDAQ